MGIIEDWGVTTDDLNEVLAYRPSVRGMLFGFVAEYKLTQMWFTNARIHAWRRFDDHDRDRPGDFGFTYRGVQIAVEVKSLQTNSIRRSNGGQTGIVQCDASDSKPKLLPTGELLKTTCLICGGFDILAVNIFEFEHKWAFAFLKNSEYPRTTFRGYTEQQRQHLLATSVRVVWPLEPPFRDNPYPLLDEIVAEKETARRASRRGTRI